MHKLILGSHSADRLFYCCLISQTLKFLELYRDLHAKKPRFANDLLRAYRRRRPWLNISIRKGRLSVVMPGGCGTYGSLKHARSELMGSIRYGVMNMILLIKKAEGESWDFWGWKTRRDAEIEATKQQG